MDYHRLLPQNISLKTDTSILLVSRTRGNSVFHHYAYCRLLQA